MGGLPMDWLRSGDLKEEKVITTSLLIITAKQKFSLGAQPRTLCHSIQ